MSPNNKLSVGEALEAVSARDDQGFFTHCGYHGLKEQSLKMLYAPASPFGGSGYVVPTFAATTERASLPAPVSSRPLVAPAPWPHHYRPSGR